MNNQLIELWTQTRQMFLKGATQVVREIDPETKRLDSNNRER